MSSETYYDNSRCRNAKRSTTANHDVMIGAGDFARRKYSFMDGTRNAYMDGCMAAHEVRRRINREIDARAEY